MTVDEIITHLSRTLRRAGIRRIGVFGSMARGEERDGSDVDILVDFEPGSRTYDNLYMATTALEEAFHRRVDLVTTDALSRHIGPKILQEVRYVDLPH